MNEMYAWVPWFQELVRKIADGGEAYLSECARKVDWKKDNPKLLQFGDENIDPFSFIYYLAQCGLRKERKEIYQSVHSVFGIKSDDLLSAINFSDLIIPSPQFRTMVLFHDNGKGEHQSLWKMFRQAVTENPDINQNDFSKVLNIRYVDVSKLTQCLFLINPNYFMPIDNGVLKSHKALNLPDMAKARTQIKDEKNGWENYQSLLPKFKAAFPKCDFYKINCALYLMSADRIPDIPLDDTDECSESLKAFIGKIRSESVLLENRKYWLVGANWGGDDRTEDFVQQNRWENGHADGSKGEYVDAVDQMQPGDKIAIKSTFTTKHDLPFDFHGKSCSTMRIKARGTVTSNSGDGQHIKVEWEKGYSEREWYILNIKWRTVHELFKDKPNDLLLIKFVFDGEDQDYAYLIKETPLPEEKNMPHINQIFYGPPGTGKTYHTANAALEILEPGFKAKTRKELRDRYEYFKKKGQIEFVTFHQSFDYEEFVEGIRPLLDDADEGQVAYEIKDGIFKRICKSAGGDGESMRLFEEAIEKLKEKCFEEMVVMETVSHNKKREVRYEEGNDSFTTKTVNGTRERPVSFKKLRKFYENPENKRGPWAKMIFKYLKENYGLDEARPTSERENYVLIIDEINRGNISRIFGELITLVEKSKRLDEAEATTVTLPYSGESFGVPNNLYIIGTMNTADRSIALLDNALRRRFRFKEMMPRYDELNKINVEGVNIGLLLKAMNERIETLYDRDHQIGHSYFLRLQDTPEVGVLKDIIRHEILPLLQEYFYDDWARIDAVFNSSEFLSSNSPSGKIKNEDLFDSDKKLWSVNENSFDEIRNFQKIYDDTHDAKNDSSS